MVAFIVHPFSTRAAPHGLRINPPLFSYFYNPIGDDMIEQKQSPPRIKPLILLDAAAFLLALLFVVAAAWILPGMREKRAQKTPEPSQAAAVSPAPIAISAATPSPTLPPATPTPEPGDFSAAFAEATLQEGMDYVIECADYKIGIEERSVENAVLLFADVYIRDIHVLKTAFANDSFDNTASKFEDIIKLCRERNAMFAISGDYVGPRTDGIVFRNGELLRNAYCSSFCVLYTDGTMAVYEKREKYAKELMETGVWQTWCFGPNLLDENGHSMEITHDLMRLNPRCAIGYYEPGHYCFVVVDGRQKHYSIGMTLTELSAYMESLGCKVAYNLDGGQTAQMVLDDGILNQPTDGGRRVGDIIYLERTADEG